SRHDERDDRFDATASAVRPNANVPAASASRLLAVAVESSVCDRQPWLHIGPPVADRALDDTSAKNRPGQPKSAEQLPARRFPRATGCRWTRHPPAADQKTVLTAIILRFLQQSVSEEGDGLRLRTLLSFSNFELNLLALFERAVAVHLDCAPVNEHVLVFAFEGDESVALFSVEPLDGTLCHYFSIQCSAIDIPHLSRDQATASGMRKLVKLNRPRDFSH